MEEKSIAIQEFKLLMYSLDKNSKQLTEIFNQLAESPNIDLALDAQNLIDKNTWIINKAIEMAKMIKEINCLIPELKESRASIEETRENLEKIWDFVLKP